VPNFSPVDAHPFWEGAEEAVNHMQTPNRIERAFQEGPPRRTILRMQSHPELSVQTPKEKPNQSSLQKQSKSNLSPVLTWGQDIRSQSNDDEKGLHSWP